jgi:uncharacterized protein (DUF697 family)/tellurite resistance protein
MLSSQEKRGILAIAIMAAFADGGKADSERESIRSIADGIGEVDGVSMSSILTDIMLRRIDLAGAVALLQTPESRLLAYEVAVQVCDADGLRNAEETAYLDRLAAALGMGGREQAEAAQPADELASVLPEASTGGSLGTLAAAPTVGPSVPPAVSSLPAPIAQPAQGAAPVNLDDTIRNYAIVAGALELLPQSLAGMAVIPVQIRMVHQIGQAHGQSLGTGNIKELLAVLGIGLTSQFMEGFARKLLGGLLKRTVGKWGGKAGKAGTSVAMSFLTTYALGHVANQYYGGGKTMSTETLKAAYQNALGQAEGLRTRYMPAMQQQAANLNLSSIMDMVKGGKIPAVPGMGPV